MKSFHGHAGSQDLPSPSAVSRHMPHYNVSVNNGAHLQLWSWRVILPSDAIAILACVSTLSDVCTARKPRKDTFLSTHPHGYVTHHTICFLLPPPHVLPWRNSKGFPPLSSSTFVLDQYRPCIAGPSKNVLAEKPNWELPRKLASHSLQWLALLVWFPRPVAKYEKTFLVSWFYH